jgi:hypothetical protein
MQGGHMRIFIRDGSISPDRSVRHALYILFKAGIYSAEGGGTVSDPAAVLVDAEHASEAFAALSQAGMRAIFE